MAVFLATWAVAMAAAAAPSRPVLQGPAEARRLVIDAPAWQQADASPDAIATAFELLRAGGWLWARVGVSAAADTLWLDPGPRARIASVSISCLDTVLVQRFQEASEIVSGSDYRPDRWEAQVRRGLRALGEQGYAFAGLSLREIEDDPQAGTVALKLVLSPGKTTRVAEILIEGATHTRPEILRRFAGIGLGSTYRESMLEQAKGRLLARDVVSSVNSIAPELKGTTGEEVAIRVNVSQPAATGRVSAAVGVVRDPSGTGTRVTGSVDLALLDLFGTARQFRASWLDDGVARRRFDVSYLEPLILGSPLDLRASLGNRHQDDVFDTVLGSVALRLPWLGNRNLELGAGVERTTFEGTLGRTRSRSRVEAALELLWARPEGAGLHGALETRVSAARVTESFTFADSAQVAARTEDQTLVDARGRLGWAFSSTLSLLGQATWQSVSGDRPFVPLSEQWYVGGANSVRGYREEQFHGETVAYGGGELAVGPSRGGQGYAFYDIGWVRETFDPELIEPGAAPRRDRWLHGFGLGLRSAAAFGRVDVSVGFADELSFDAGKVHITLLRDF